MRFWIIPLLLVTSVCTAKFGRFEHFDAVAPQNLQVTGSVVTGESCQMNAPITGSANLEEATRNAIEKAPKGTIGLRDVQIRSYYNLLSYQCYEVTGTPVK